MDLSARKTYILVSDTDGLYPATNLYPATDLYPEEGSMELSGNIVAGTMTLEEMVVESDLVFGQLYSTKFEVTLYDVEDLSGRRIQVLQEDTSDNTIRFLFSGIIDSSKKNKDGLDRQIVAYDRAYTYSTKNVASWWTTFWNNKGYQQNPNVTATIKELRTSLCDSLSIVYDDVTLPNDGVAVTKNMDISSITFSAMLKMLCEINCCFPHFNGVGELLFIMLDDESTAVNISGQFEGINSTFEDYTTDTITGIQFRDSTGEIKYQVGTADNVYVVSQDNMLLYGLGTSALTTVGNNMLTAIGDITYVPCEVKMIVGNFDYVLGTKINTGISTFYILQNSFSNSQLIDQTMRATGNQHIDTDKMGLETSSVILNEKYSRLVHNVEEFRLEFGDYQEEVSAEFAITSHQIKATVAESQKEWDTTGYTITIYGYAEPWVEGYNPSDYSNQYYLNQKNGNLYYAQGAAWTFVRTLSSVQSALQSQITANSNNINLKVSKNDVIAQINLSSETAEIEARRINLTGYVTISSLGAGGTTTVNGDRIHAGCITSNNNTLTFDLDNNKITCEKFVLESTYLNITEYGILTSGDTETTTWSAAAKDYTQIDGNTSVISNGNITVNHFEVKYYTLPNSSDPYKQYYVYNRNRYVDLSNAQIEFYIAKKTTDYVSKIRPKGVDPDSSGNLPSSAMNLEIITNRLYVNTANGSDTGSARIYCGGVDSSGSVGATNLYLTAGHIIEEEDVWNGSLVIKGNNGLKLDPSGSSSLEIYNYDNSGWESGYTGWFTDVTGQNNGIRHRGGYCDMRWVCGIMVEISPW